MNLNEKLLNLRKKSGLSQGELADKLSVSRQTISKWELGETSPDINQAKKLAEIYMISLEDLINNKTLPIPNQRISRAKKMVNYFFIGITVIWLVVILVSLYAWFI
jgi:transcriptional regulator with XRE-family HTH domain